MSRIGYYSHWVPGVRLKQDHPFSYKLKIVEVENNNFTIPIEITQGEDLKQLIREALFRTFPFHIYLDETTYDKEKLSKYNQTFKVILKEQQTFLKGTDERVAEKIKGKTVDRWVVVDTKYIVAYDFASEYRFTLIKSLKQLREVTKDYKVISFDTETTGLNPTIDNIVGISFATTIYNGYYIPIAHTTKFKDYNLGNAAIEEFYNIMCKKDLVYMFNARFDMRMMEYSEGLELDMGKINMIDAQLNAYFADPAYPAHDLKRLEKHFLGFDRPDLSDTLKSRGIKTFDTSLIEPTLILFYAAQDAISTLAMGIITQQYYEEFGLAGQIDQMILYRLMKMENNPIRVDIDYLKEQLDIITPRLKALDKEIKSQIGDVNLNSPKQKIALFKSFGLDTGEKTKTGAMATGKEAVSKLIERLESQGKKYPEWLGLLNERADLDKLKGSFFESLLTQAELNDGYIRINYRHGVTSTGRFSSGEEKIF